MRIILSTSLPKNPSTTYVCLHDLRKDKPRTLYNKLLQSQGVTALVLANTCNSYKIPHEFRTDKEIPVLVVTKSTADALCTLLKDTAEVRVECEGEGGEGGERGEGVWPKETDGRDDLRPEGVKLEWDDSCITR